MVKFAKKHMGVSKNRGGPSKLSILIGVSIINHPFWGTTIFGNTHIEFHFEIKSYGGGLASKVDTANDVLS